MNFDFSEDQKLLQHTAREYLAEHAPLALCREVLETDIPYAKDLWKGAAEMGWLGAAIPEEYGGAGFGHLELAVIAEEVGRALAPIPFGSSVYLATEALLVGGSAEQKQRLLPKLASGAAIGTFALVEKPGQNAVEGVETTFAEGQLRGSKGPVLDGDVADFAVVAARGDGGVQLVIAELGGEGVERTPVTTFDPSRSAANIHFDGTPAELLGEAGDNSSLIDRVLDRAAVLTAFEQLGAAERAFSITKEFIEGRYAFGRPVASFQAVKHRLADLWCEIQLARSNAYYGAWALSNEAPELDVAACISRIQASTSFDLTTIEMIELHGGVGFTWEYDCHLFYRRAKLLSAWLGTVASWRDKLVDRVEARESAA
ncbi:MAG: acyl-CoA/acyl-ACP dehydrogenase [Deltaproteobacteria bacterium]|nr:acyl-CoA/acyl-ACP dehydrogenase [Deltaproteobacteria bacterium]MBW2417944.1 acyl-CoA/acyl-ACP dehydrogenase [Deltaproteobacteria bacterium]